ncbi:RNA polymerase III-inhibiting protein maf1 [Asimina triloba]
MATEEQAQPHHPDRPIAADEKKMNVSLSIWPPTQRTRDAVAQSLVKNLSSPSLLSKRYGSMPPEEAASAARTIEEEAFSAASSKFGDNNPASDEDDGIEMLQIYSKEISKRVLEAVKARAAATASPVESMQTPSPASATVEDVSSSIESESLHS